MTDHAILPPSSSAQWGHCSGWMTATTGLPNNETEETRKGEAAHWIVSETLKGRRSGYANNPKLPFPPCNEYVGKTATNGYVIDEELTEGAQVIVDDVTEILAKHTGPRVLIVEKRVEMPQIHDHNWGTLDAAIYFQELNLLYVWDYKNGHREVRAKDNLQLINYVAGLLNLLNIDGHEEQRIRLSMRIVQPFCYKPSGPLDIWDIPLTDLRPYYNNLTAKAHEAFTNPKLSTGIWCRDCKVVGKCSAARASGYSFIDYVNRPYEMDNTTGADLAIERRILSNGLKVAKARLNAIEDELKQRLNNGETDSGLILEARPGRLGWTVSIPEVILFAAQFGVDIIKEDVLTPTQAISKIPIKTRDMFKQAIKTIASRSTGSLTLINAKDSISFHAFSKRT